MEMSGRVEWLGDKGGEQDLEMAMEDWIVDGDVGDNCGDLTENDGPPLVSVDESGETW